MMHDMAITPNYHIIMHLPLTFDPEVTLGGVGRDRAG